MDLFAIIILGCLLVVMKNGFNQAYIFLLCFLSALMLLLYRLPLEYTVIFGGILIITGLLLLNKLYNKIYNYFFLEKDLNVKEYPMAIPNINKNAFLKLTYNKFININLSWNSADYNRLQSLLTNELYNMYKSELDNYKKQNYHNILKDFNKIKYFITDYYKNDNLIIIKTILKTSYYDYTVDINQKRVIEGSKYLKKKVILQLEWVAKEGNNDNICPNCGAKMANQASQVCEYCGATIYNNKYDFVLANKKLIKEISKRRD